MPALQLTGFGEPAEVVTLVSQPALVAGRDALLLLRLFGPLSEGVATSVGRVFLPAVAKGNDGCSGSSEPIVSRPSTGCR